MNLKLRPVSMLALVLMLLLAACMGDSMDDSFDEISADMGGFAAATTAAPASDAGADFDEAAQEAPAEAREDALGSGGIEPALLQTRSLGRDIIFTADMTVAVTDVAAAGAEATRIIVDEDHGGSGFDYVGIKVSLQER